MEPKKDLATLLRAYAQVRQMGEQVPPLVLVGSGSEYDLLRSLALDLGLKVTEWHGAAQEDRAVSLSGDVLFYGFRQIESLPVFYGLALAFILPSISEEWGLVVNEAMACGLPVVVSEVAGCAPNLIHHGKTGFTFEPGNVTSLAGHLFHLSTDEGLRQNMAEAARKHIAEWGLDRFRNGVRAALQAVTSA
jgi:glycosyltransferase involved in cell wall biosynthesis